MSHKTKVQVCVSSLGALIAVIIVALGLTGWLSAATLPAATVISVPPAAGGDGIQKALDSLPSGGEVDLEPGTYIIHLPVVLRRDNQALHGKGQATILYLADNANCPVVVLGSPRFRLSAPVTGVVISDLLIDGNRTHQRAELWRSLAEGSLYNNGIDVWNVNGAAVERVVCCRCRSGGLVSTARTRRLTVTDFTAFDNQFDGLACYSTEESRFSNLDLHDNLGAGISLDLDFNHNVIDGGVLSGNDLGIFMRQSRDNTFQGLKIEKSHHHGVFMAQTIEGMRLCPGTACTGNTFEKLLVTNCGGRAFLVNNASCVNNLISSSQFLDNGQGGLSQDKTDPVSVRDLVQQDTTPVIPQKTPLATQAPARAIVTIVKHF